MGFCALHWEPRAGSESIQLQSTRWLLCHHCGHYPGNHRWPCDVLRTHHVIGPVLSVLQAFISLILTTSLKCSTLTEHFVCKENEAQTHVIEGQCHVACDCRGWGSEPDLQAQNTRQYLWSWTHQGTSHRNHYIHLCLKAEAVPSWGL